MDCYSEYKHHHHYQPPSSLYANPYYSPLPADNPALRQGFNPESHHQYYDGYSSRPNHHHHQQHPAYMHGGSYAYEHSTEHNNSQFYNYSNAHHQPSYYDPHHPYDSYRNASSNAYRYHHYQQPIYSPQMQQQQQQHQAPHFYPPHHHHQQQPPLTPSSSDHFNRYSTPATVSPSRHEHQQQHSMRGEFLSSTPPFVTASESNHNENKLLNNEIKHMESITAAVSSSSAAQQQSSTINTASSPTNSNSNSSTNANLNSHNNSDGNDISIAKINDSVDDKNEIVNDSGNDDHENQQVKSETSSPSVNCDSENGLKSESDNDTENGNRHNKSSNDDNDEVDKEEVDDRRKCNLDRNLKQEENSPENNSQSESYKENLHLQGEASSLLPRITNNFHHEDATGKRAQKLAKKR